MRRLPLWLLLWLLCVAGAARADGDWAGRWDTHWRGSGGHLLLEQAGDVVTGRYPLYHGSISGKVTADGSRLQGRWTVGSRSGDFIAVLSRDKRTFTGRFDTGEWWTGERARHAEVTRQIGLRSPREAFMSFTVAGNLARSGNDDAWAAAADAVEFDGAPGAMTRTEQLHHVHSLFALVDLTTFRYWSIPDAPPGAGSVAVRLEQLRSAAVLTLTLRRDEAGDWRIVVPAARELHATREAMLAVYGAKPPAADAFRQLRNPRDTMRAFLEGMADWDGPGRALALSTLDLGAVPELLRRTSGDVAAQYLRRVLDHIGLVGLQSIPDDGAGRDPYVHFVHGVGRIVIAPVGNAPDAPWQFTAQTVADIRDLYIATETLPPPLAVPPGLIPHSLYFTLRDWVGSNAPALLGRVRHLEIWQALAALLALFCAFAVAHLCTRLICSGLRRLPPNERESRGFRGSLMILIAVALASPVPGALGVAEGIREYSLPFWGILACVAAGVVAWHLLRLTGVLFAAMAERTATATDDILVTLVLASARMGVVVACALGVAFFLSIPTTNILAGLGIGGLALAFASRETLSNVFGAGILVADRPFRRGDWIKAGDVEGSVEAVGIRSTRVRTKQDSLVFVPNGKLVDSTINNLGTRRHRLVTLQLVVTAGATPEKLDAFTAAVRQRIIGDGAFVGGRTDVGVSTIGAGGIEMTLTSYLNASTGSDENAARHALLLDLVRLAQQHGLKLGTGMSPPE